MGGRGAGRNWVSHPHLKDEVVGKTRREACVPQEAHAHAAPEKQVRREQCAYPGSCPQLGCGFDRRATLNSLSQERKKFLNVWPEGTGGRAGRKEGYL